MIEERDNILIVDDDPEVLMALEAELSDYYEVTPVMSAEQALASLRSHVYSAIVSDVRMPGIDGLSLIKQCAVRYPDMVRIILTAFDDEEVQETALGPHGAYKLIKPWRDDLQVTLQNALKQRNSTLSHRMEADLKSEALDLDLRLNSKVEEGEIISQAAGEMARLPEVAAASIYAFDSDGNPVLVKDFLTSDGFPSPKLSLRRMSPTSYKGHFIYSVPIGEWARPIAAVALTLTSNHHSIVRYLDFVGRQAFRTYLISKGTETDDRESFLPVSRSKTSSKPDPNHAITPEHNPVEWLVLELAAHATVVISAADGLRELSKRMTGEPDHCDEQYKTEMEELTSDLSNVGEDLLGVVNKLKEEGPCA